MYLINSYRYGGVVVDYLYDDVSAMYTLRRPFMTTLWTNAVLRLRRSSDNEQRYVFFDTNGKISLNSFVADSNTIPTTTTLGTWVGANNANVTRWLGITTDNIIDDNKRASQSTNAEQPQFISSGTIITKNGEPAIDFLSDTRYLNGPINTDLDSGNDFTVLSVANNNLTANSVGAVWGTSILLLAIVYNFTDPILVPNMLGT